MKKILSLLLIVSMVCAFLSGCKESSDESSDTEVSTAVESGEKWVHGQIEDDDFLAAQGETLVNKNGDEVVLRGTNAGGWLVQEFWMCPTESTDNVTCQLELIETLTSRFGEEQAEELLDVYEENFWTEEDFDNCADMGMNVLRLPFWYRTLLDEDGNMRDDAFDRLDWFVEEAGERGMYVILDMHGAQGSQNEKDHSGDTTQGAAFFYGDDAEDNQDAWVKLWKKIAEHYAGNPVIAGYDLLNEPYCDLPETTGTTCWNLYDRAYKAIRKVDSDHIIIMEAKWDPQNLPDPDEYGWTNVMYEYHQYNYDDQQDAEAQFEGIELKLDLADAADYGVPNLIGETSFFSNMESWKMCLNEMNKRGCSYTTWTYKVTGSNSSWGIFNITADEVNPETDSYDEIKEKWSNITTTENTELKDIVEKYLTGYYEEDA